MFRGGAVLVWIVGATVVVVATVLTAGLALVLEDALPKPDAGARFVRERVTLVVIALVVLLGALALRSVLHRRTGTLFHVQLLDEGMEDRRGAALATAIGQKMSVRSITRWVDFTHATRNGVIDLVDACREVGTALEESINSDRDDTGYTVAPNVLWPIALGIGGYLPPVRTLRLLELPKPRDPVREFILTHGLPVRLAAPAEHLDGDPSAGRVGVWLAFSPEAAKYESSFLAPFGVTEVYPFTMHGVAPVRGWTPPRLESREMAALGPRLAEHLTRIKVDCKGRELVVAAMIPKTVALALGWYLAQARCRFFTGTHLLHFDEGTERYVPMRVKPTQPATPPGPLEHR